MEIRERIILVSILLLFAAGYVGSYLWRDRDAVAAVHFVYANTDVSGCRVIGDFRADFQTLGTRRELSRSGNADLLDAELRLRQEAASAGVDTVLATRSALFIEGTAYRCATKRGGVMSALAWRWTWAASRSTTNERLISCLATIFADQHWGRRSGMAVNLILCRLMRHVVA
jgi:hypothetical protein